MFISSLSQSIIDKTFDITPYIDNLDMLTEVSQTDTLTSILLMLIAYGQQKEVLQLLQMHPELAFSRASITDPAHREFTNITPIQFTHWNQDIHILLGILQILAGAAEPLIVPLGGDDFYMDYDATVDAYLDNLNLEILSKLYELISDLLNQPQQFSNQGSTCDISLVINAYDYFINNGHDASWEDIDKCQNLLPASMIHEFTAPGLQYSFDISENKLRFLEAHLPRNGTTAAKNLTWYDFMHDNYDQERFQPDGWDGSGRRIRLGGARWQIRNSATPIDILQSHASTDKTAIHHLARTRRQQLATFFEKLEQRLNYHNCVRL